MTAPASALLPCPFCGADGAFTEPDGPNTVVFCRRCDASLGAHNAVEQWNRRAHLAAGSGEGWVSVETRLPDDGAEVLVYHVLGDQARSPRAYDIAAFMNGKWIFMWDRGGLNPPPQWVTHWQPLPPAPTGEK